LNSGKPLGTGRCGWLCPIEPCRNGTLPPVPSSLAIQNLVTNLVKLRDAHIIKLKSRVFRAMSEYAHGQRKI